MSQTQSVRMNLRPGNRPRSFLLHSSNSGPCDPRPVIGLGGQQRLRGLWDSWREIHCPLGWRSSEAMRERTISGSRDSWRVLKVGVLAGVALVASPVGRSPAAADDPVQVVQVTLREYSIALPVKLRPGATTFVIHNRGRFPHNVTAIYGPGRFHSGTVLPGKVKRMKATLVPGAYLVACTILDGGHLARGMFAIFTIGSRAHGSAHWHYP